MKEAGEIRFEVRYVGSSSSLFRHFERMECMVIKHPIKYIYIYIYIYMYPIIYAAMIHPYSTALFLLSYSRFVLHFLINFSIQTTILK
uniref:Uncharacterized protein n=1 Tax=Kalanchoe fedtschenkoi TaxID=63787 RepID=A0A7N0VGL4_KALFE